MVCPGAGSVYTRYGCGRRGPLPTADLWVISGWWLLVSGAVGFIVLRAKRLVTVSDVLSEFRVKSVLHGVALFIILYLLVFGLESYYGIGLMYVVPFFRALSVQRAPIALAYVPFFLVYFTVEGLYLHSNSSRHPPGYADFKPAVIKTSPYILLMLLQYGGMYLWDVRLIPGLIGFFLEFLWGIVPIFAVTTLWSGWLRKITGNMTAGVVLNTLAVSWVAAATFPFGAFF